MTALPAVGSELEPYTDYTVVQPPLARVLRLAGVIIVVFLAVFAVWAAIAPLSKAAIAPGIIEVEGRRRVIQHLEGGIVREILVSENQRVKAGQPLMRLDETQSGAVADATRSEYLALLVEQARLNAELDSARQLALSPEVLAASNEQAVRDAIENQRVILASRRQSLEAQKQVLRESASQARADIGGLEAQIASQNSQLELLGAERQSIEELVNEQLERRSRLLEIERAIAAAEGALGGLRGQVARARQVIAEAEAKARSVENMRRDEVVAELRNVQMRLVELKERVRSATDVNNRRTIYANMDGQVVNLRYTTVGGVVRPGDPVLDIVPEHEQLIVSARLRPTDIENVHVGLDTQIHLLPYSSRKVPMLAGRVLSVSGDALSGKTETSCTI